MKEKIKVQKAFIQIPILIAIITSIIAVSVITTGVVLYKQGNLNLTANVSETITDNKEQEIQEQEIAENNQENQEEIKNLNREVEELKSQEPEIIYKEVPISSPQVKTDNQQQIQQELKIEKCKAEAQKGVDAGKQIANFIYMKSLTDADNTKNEKLAEMKERTDNCFEQFDGYQVDGCLIVVSADRKNVLKWYNDFKLTLENMYNLMLNQAESNYGKIYADCLNGL